MNTLTLIVLAALAIWMYKPLRVFLVQRTNRTVKVLLIVMPLLAIGRMVYNVSSGQQDDLITSLLLVGGLLALWIALVWLGNTLEKRKPTKAQAPDLAMISRLPGMPRPPAALTTPQAQQAARTAYDVARNPEVQRAARAVAQAAIETASQIDRKDVAGSLGRAGGRWAARLKRSMAADNR
jgi:hypothetical protein